MVKVDINANDIKAFDEVCNKAQVSPMTGYILVNLRLKIQNAIKAEMAEKQQGEEKGNGKKGNRKTNRSNKKRDTGTQ